MLNSMDVIKVLVYTVCVSRYEKTIEDADYYILFNINATNIKE